MSVSKEMPGSVNIWQKEPRVKKTAFNTLNSSGRQCSDPESKVCIYNFLKNCISVINCSYDCRYMCVSSRIPEADVSQPLYFRLHVLLQLSRPEQHLADGADWSLAVIQRHLLFTCTKKTKTKKPKKASKVSKPECEK